MANDDEAISGVNTTDEKSGSFVTNRRQFMQATGAIGAAGLLGTTTATAQQSGDTLIELAAVQQGSGGPTDPDNDGLYEDVDGDGEMTHNDVVELFQRFDEPEIQSRAEDFDFNQNGRLDYDDIVTLQNEIESDSSGSGSDSGSGSTQAASGYAWLGISPEEIDGQTNPTLSLTTGVEYTVEWTNRTDEAHNFVIINESGEEVVSTKLTGQKGETQSITFTATDAMVAYYSESYPQAMRGSINVRTPEPSEDKLSVLFMGGPQGGSHDAPDRAIQITEYLQNRGIEVHYTDRLDDLLEDTLHKYDAWILYDNRSGLTEAQEDSLIRFTKEEGGGFVALHSASACFTESERFIEFLGGQFASHGLADMTTTWLQPDHPVFTGMEGPIESFDETYNHTNLNPDNNVLAVHDPEGQEPEPWTWVREEGEGQVFYTAWGHDERTWSKPGFKQLVENAIRWTSGNEDTIADDTRTLDPLEFVDPDVFTGIDTDIPFYDGQDMQTVPAVVGEGDNWKLMQKPLSPADTEQRIITPEGFDVQYFVTNEILPDDMDGNIINMDFDEQGRCYVALTMDYPNDVSEGRDRIVICEDTDGDGQADDFTVFAEGLSIPISMAVANGGVYVANLGHTEDEGAMLFLEDTDGDDVADEETVLFSGYGNGDTHAGPNELKVGIDNWIWGQVGYSGFSGTVGGEQHSFGSAIYRFRKDGSELQIMGSLPGNQAGIGFDEEGLAFASAATAGRPSNYLAIPGPYYQYIDGISSSGEVVEINDTNRFLPVTERVRQVDWHSGFTAAAGQSFYTARTYPEKYWNNTAFVSDGTGHLLATFWREPEGASFTAHNADNIAASTDAWFAPTFSEVGPDGNLWVADLYEYIFQHNPTPPGFETGEGNAYITPVRDKQMTRLMRLEYGDDNRGPQLDLGDASASELVDALSHDNMFWRMKAQHLLVERGETDVVSDLVNVVQTATPDSIGIAKGAVHALWTLHGLGALDADGNSAALDATMGALDNASAATRLNALRVLPGTAAVRDAILANSLLTDANMRVRMWALLTLVRTPSSQAAGEAIFQMINAGDNFEDDLLREAALLAGATHAEGFIAAYEETYGEPHSGVNVMEDDNGGFEEVTSTGPAGWNTTTYSGSATHTWAEGTASSGSRSGKISSTEGADASWNTTVSVEVNTEYTFSAYIKTENLQLGTGQSAVENSPYGATITVEELANANYPDINQSAVGKPLLTGTNDWTEVTTTFNSGDNTELTLNCLYGGYGTATGTAWYDSVSLVGPNGNDVLSNGGFENGATEQTPVSWDTTSFTGSGEFTLDTSTAHLGSNSASISSDTGLDGAWHTTVSIEDNNQYDLVGWIKTDNLQTQSDGARGALFNVHLTGIETDTLTGTNGWTEVTATFNSADIPDSAWTDGRGSSIQINALFGGYGQATGTAWFDSVQLWDPDANPMPPNIAINPGFEQLDENGEPVGWEPATFSGDATWALDDTVSHSGDNSVRISSETGGDVSWAQTHENQADQYLLSAYIKTGEDFDAGSGFGATLNIHLIGQSSLPDIPGRAINEPGQDWTYVETIVDVGDMDTLQFNLLYGGWGQSTGTAWWDDVEIRPLGDIGEGIEGMYDRIKRLLEMEDGGGGGGTDGGDDGGPDALDPSTTIQFDGYTAGWEATAPAAISGQTNPTLRLLEGEEYTVEWTNADGSLHDFDVLDADGNTLVDTDYITEEGATDTVSLTVSADMATYICTVHPGTMRGDIEVVTPGSQ